MKLRIRGNLIRFRLTQTEVETISQNKSVEELTDFGNGQIFTYSISPADISENAKASFQNGRLEIEISRNEVNKWAKSDEVGISVQQNQLKILIEKDFTCLQPRSGEDDKDTFPHPKEGVKC